MSSKESVLVGIRERKGILFGKFTDTLTHEHKRNAWEEVTTLAKSLEVIGGDKDWAFMRDKFSMWKSRVLVKVDNGKKTGTGGGKEAKFTKFDKLVLEIIGPESSTVNGLPIPESEVGQAATEGSAVQSQSAEGSPVPSQSATTAKGSSKVPPKKRRLEMEKDALDLCQSKSDGSPGTSEPSKTNGIEYRDTSRKFKQGRIRDQKLDLQNELLAIEIHEKKIAIYEKEILLGLKPSEYTKEFYEK